jgi:polyisoprenoid-binding protein YceI
MLRIMKAPRLVLAAAALLVAAVLPAAEEPLKIDRERSFVDVDVKATVDSFTGRLEKYQATVTADAATKKIRTARFEFRFADLKTGKPDRDAKMLEWLGSGDATGTFELGVLALTPDGQGQANGKLTFHGVTERVEFPVTIARADRTYTIRGEVALDYRHWGLKVIRTMGVLKVDPGVRVRFQMVGDLPPPPEE